MTPWKTTHVPIDGVSLAVHRCGSGPPLVCLNAIGHDAHDFDALAEAVSDRFELVAIEWPAHGASGPDTQPASAARYADLLTACLDRLGVRGPIVIGNSIGGSAAIRHASRHPVRALVLCGSGGLVAVTPLVKRVCALMAGLAAAGERRAWWFDAVFSLYYRRVLTEPPAAAQRRRIVAWARANARVLREAWRSFAQPSADVRHLAERLDVPVWAAWGRKDITSPLSVSRPTLKRLKRGSISTFDCGHAAFLEAPEAFVPQFLAFVGTLGAAPGPQPRPALRAG